MESSRILSVSNIFCVILCYMKAITTKSAEMNTKPVLENTGTEETTRSEPYIDDSVYIGEYLDSDLGE